MYQKIYAAVWGPDAQTALYLTAVSVPAVMAAIGFKMLGM